MYLVIDTETCNTLEQPFCYDISYAITDRYGNIYLERSFVVAEMFLDNKDLMKSCYFAEKIPQYWEDIKNGKRVLKSIYNIRKQIKQDMRDFKIQDVGAYNMGFDKRALNNTIRYCSKSLIRWFFPFGTQYFCIWNMACQVITTQKTFLKENVINEKGNYITNAERVYQYISKDKDFQEEHTGLCDVRIESQILAKCFSQHKKMTTNIYRACWQIPNKAKKELLVA